MENKEKLIRKIAQRVVKKYDLFPPIDVTRVISEKGICYIEENLGTNADGYSDLSDSNLKIVINSQIDYLPRKRFTIAHELGHIFVNWHNDVTLCLTDNEYVEHNMLDIQEREANVFASELLMPTDWVKGILGAYGQDKIRHTIEILSEKANTSIMASFYALENAMEYGHVFFVSGKSSYPKKFITGDMPGFCFYGYSYQETYEIIANIKEHFEISYYNVDHYILPSCPEIDKIKNDIYGCEKIIDVFIKVFRTDYAAWIFWANKIINMMPQTYVGFLYQGEELLKYYKNADSEIVLKFENKTNLIRICKEFNFEYEYYSFDDNWSIVFVAEPFYKMPQKNGISYDSKKLLKIILEDIYSEEKDILKASCKINGVIGSALSHRIGLSQEQVYNLLQKKFRRIEFVEFLNDIRFDEFVFLKAKEKSNI